MTSVPRLTATTALVIVAFVSGILFAGRDHSQATVLLSGPEKMPSGIDLDPVWKAWRLLDEKFVPATTTIPATDQDRVWGMIEGLAATYGDPYTVFMPPREAKMFEEDIRGTFGGVGIEIGMRDNVLTIIAPLKGTPGDLAGLRAGDIIVEIDGEDTRSLNVDDAVERIRGEVDTEVVFTIARQDEFEFLHIPVTRQIIEIPTLDTDVRDGVFIVSLYNFGGTAVREFRNAIREFLASGNKALIVDLRSNPGGYLDASVEIASLFLPIGKVVVTEDYGNNEEHVHRSKGYDVVPEDVLIVVLADGGSASASEILAGALADHDRATFIGTRTFGKGSVQELVDLTPETSLKITIARWLTPNGISLSQTGLAPDHEVPLTREDVEHDRDPQLDAAIQYLTTGRIPVTPEPGAATSTSAQ